VGREGGDQVTLQASQIGDQGQRFEVHCRGYPEDGDQVIGWATTLDRAEAMAASIRLAPRAISGWVVDRETGQKVHCELFSHDWRKEYYGHRCRKCDEFHAFGCAPWDRSDEECGLT